MPDPDRLLGDALDEARSLRPKAPPFDVVRRLARRRAVVRRAVPVAAVLLFAAAGLTAAAVQGDGSGDGRVAIELAPGEGDEEPGPLRTTTTWGPSTPSTSAGAGSPTSTSMPRLTPGPTHVPNPASTSTTTARDPAEEPPDAFALGHDGERRMATGSSCWRPTAPGRAALCRDTTAQFADDSPQVTITVGSSVSVRWAIDEQPSRVEAFLIDKEGRRTELQPVQENPTWMVPGAPPGEYLLMVQSVWRQGDVLHGVRLLVTEPPPS